jgi:hypothetical protein
LAAIRREARTLSRQWCFVMGTFALLAACGGDGGMLPTQTGPVTFRAANDLIAPVTIKVDGSPYLILSSGRSTQVTLPANTRLTWTSAKPADGHGQMIPDEIGEQTVDVSSITGALEITNVIGSQTYFTARIFNFTSTRVSIGVFEGSALWCAALLPEASAGGPGFTLIGYYRLLPATEMRAYTASADCTGPYVPWPSSQLTAFEAKSGLLTLSLEPTS